MNALKWVGTPVTFAGLLYGVGDLEGEKWLRRGDEFIRPLTEQEYINWQDVVRYYILGHSRPLSDFIKAEMGRTVGNYPVEPKDRQTHGAIGSAELFKVLHPQGPAPKTNWYGHDDGGEGYMGTEKSGCGPMVLYCAIAAVLIMTVFYFVFIHKKQTGHGTQWHMKMATKRRVPPIRVEKQNPSKGSVFSSVMTELNQIDEPGQREVIQNVVKTKSIALYRELYLAKENVKIAEERLTKFLAGNPQGEIYIKEALEADPKIPRL